MTNSPKESDSKSTTKEGGENGPLETTQEETRVFFGRKEVLIQSSSNTKRSKD